VSLAGVERKNMILTMLDETGKVKVTLLSERFQVSTETIRRDLDDLERDNKLKKVYGGAIKITKQTEPDPQERDIIYSEEKKRIGRHAARLIEDNDVIFIDEGSTPLQVIHYLLDKRNLTVMTSSIPALLLLIDYQKQELYDGRVLFVGGEVNGKQLRVTGPIAEKMMEDFYVNKAFISTDGITLDYGITTYDPDKALFSKKLLQSSEQAVVVADHSKISIRRFAKIADLTDIGSIVCDMPPPQNWLAVLESREVNWITAE